jgi:hypothetical protein
MMATEPAGGVTAEWVPGTHGAYELMAGDALLARLWPRLGDPMSARVATARARWVVSCKGLVVPRLVVRPAAQPNGPVLLEVRRDLRHHWSLPISAGHVLRWRLAGLASPNWVCTDQHGAALIQILVGPDRPGGSPSYLRASARVDLAPATCDLAELPLVMVVGWFLVLLYRIE